MANGFNYKFKEEVEAESLDWNPSDKKVIIWNAVSNTKLPFGDYIAVFKKKGEIKTTYIFELTDKNQNKGFQFCVLTNERTKEIHSLPLHDGSRFGRIGNRNQIF